MSNCITAGCDMDATTMVLIRQTNSAAFMCNACARECQMKYKALLVTKEAVTKLILAAEDFVEKCESGKARSVKSYKAFKEALGEMQ